MALINNANTFHVMKKKNWKNVLNMIYLLQNKRIINEKKSLCYLFSIWKSMWQN